MIMRYLLILFLSFFSISAFSQGIYNKAATNIKQNRLMADSVLGVPRDTSATNNATFNGAPVGDSGRIAYQFGKFWGHNATGWAELGSGAVDLSDYFTKQQTRDSFIRNQTLISQQANSRISGGHQAAFFLSRQRLGSASIIITDTATNLSRWGYVKTGTELGSNTGGNWVLYRYDDAGTTIDAAMMNRRNDGKLFAFRDLVVGNGPDDSLANFKVYGNIQMTDGDTLPGKIMTSTGKGVATWAEPYDWNRRVSIYTSNDTMASLGNSFTAGVGAYSQGSQDTTKGYANSVARNLNMRLLNWGLSGSGVFQAATRAANRLPLNNKYMVTCMAGFNDMRHAYTAIPGGIPTLKTYELIRNNTINVIANALLLTAVPGDNASITKFGTWSTFNDSSFTGKARKLGGLGILASTTADSVSYTFTNPNVVVQVLISDSTTYPLGKLDFYIDDFPYLLGYDGNNRMNGITDGYNNGTIGTTFLLFSNLGAGTHKLVIKKPNAGNTNICVIGHLQAPVEAPPVIIGGIPYMNQAGYESFGGNNYFMDYGEMAVKEAVKYFAGWPVAFAQTKLYYDTTMIFTDNVHPNNLGHLKLATAFLDRVTNISDSVDTWQLVTNRGNTTTNRLTQTVNAASSFAYIMSNINTSLGHGLYINTATGSGIGIRVDKNAAKKFEVDGEGDVGVNGATATSSLHVAGSIAMAVRTVTATTTLDAADYALYANNSGSDIVVNLPAASACTGRIYVVKKIGNNANTVTIDPSGAELIDDASTYVIGTYKAGITFQSDGTKWWIH